MGVQDKSSENMSPPSGETSLSIGDGSTQPEGDLPMEVQDYGLGERNHAAERICELLEETPKGLDHICETFPELVTARTFHRWLEKSPDLRQRYARAKERQADFLAAEVIRIADTPCKGIKVKTDSDGNKEVTEGDMIEHRRLQVDARKWLAGKLAPKKYGDKVEVENTGEVKHTIKFTRG